MIHKIARGPFVLRASHCRALVTDQKLKEVSHCWS